MNHTKITLKGLIIILFGMLLISCSAEDGANGAIGPQGEQGPAGEDGQDGQDGLDGNANVIASAWIPEEFSNNSVSYTSFTVTDEAFTQEISDSGTVLVYGSDGVNTVPVPVVFSNQSYYFVLPDTLGEIIFIARTVDGTSQFFGVFTDFRYVIIPAGNTTSRQARAINFEKMTYYEVMDHFGLEY